MKVTSILLLLTSLAIAGLAAVERFLQAKVTIPEPYIIILALSILSAIFAVVLLASSPDSPEVTEEPVEKKKEEIAHVPKAATVSANNNDQAILVMTLLQERGRLLDFLMEDVASYSDEEIGGAARVIHQGCSEVVKECFSPEAVSAVEEEKEIILEEGYTTSEYKIVGNVDTNPPYKGIVTHKGWKAGKVKLPVLNKSYEGIEKPILVPAEVEVS